MVALAVAVGLQATQAQHLGVLGILHPQAHHKAIMAVVTLVLAMEVLGVVVAQGAMA